MTFCRRTRDAQIEMDGPPPPGGDVGGPAGGTVRLRSTDALKNDSRARLADGCRRAKRPDLARTRMQGYRRRSKLRFSDKPRPFRRTATPRRCERAACDSALEVIELWAATIPPPAPAPAPV